MAEERRLVGYFCEANQRFCYADEKVNGRKREYNVPVYAIKEPACCEIVRLENERIKRQIDLLAIAEQDESDE